MLQVANEFLAEKAPQELSLTRGWGEMTVTCRRLFYCQESDDGVRELFGLVDWRKVSDLMYDL